MKFVLYTNSVSAHQLPLARELVKRLGAENFRYVYTGENLQRGNQEVAADEPWIIRLAADETFTLLLSCDILLVGGIYPIDLMEQRLAAGKKTLYMSERWFKPIEMGVGGRCWCRLPGWVRMLHPGYFRRARRLAKMLSGPNCWYLPIGPWAAKDMRLVQRLTFSGCAANPFVPWGYFVAPSSHSTVQPPLSNSQTSKPQNIQTSKPFPLSRSLRVLWVGRMLDWKCVDTIIRAVALANSQAFKRSNGQTFKLTLVGDGPENPRLQKLASKLLNFQTSKPLILQPPFSITFLPPVPLEEVRSLMRQHDIYVLASNAQEGWGAALSEALSEGMACLGTFEAGASAALLPCDNLFHAGDYRSLADVLTGRDVGGMTLPYVFTPKGAAGRLIEMIAAQRRSI